MLEWTPNAPARIAFLGDIHGNAAALERAVAWIDAATWDHVVILGDLLTYGCDPAEVLALTSRLVADHDALLLQGNHDRIYLDLLAGRTGVRDRLPDWIRESVDWTLERMDTAVFARLPWRERAVLGPMLVAHAGPYEFGDWSYINSAEDNLRALRAIEAQGHALGVFGHTHRQNVAVADPDAPDGVGLTTTDTFLARTAGTPCPPAIVNAGSVGQPRHRDRRSTFLRLEIREDGVDATFVPLDYDLARHLAAIDNAGLSPPTQHRLRSFF